MRNTLKNNAISLETLYDKLPEYRKKRVTMYRIFFDLLFQIRERRNSLGISQLELARRTGISRDTICRVESGETNITLKTLYKISEAMDCEVKIEIIEKNS